MAHTQEHQEEVALYLERAEKYLVGIAAELRGATAAYACGALDDWMRRKAWAAEQLRLLAFVLESLARRVASC